MTMDRKRNKIIGIVSYNCHSNHLNYGAALHSWAFQRFLINQGIESIVIDYYPKNLECHNVKYPILNNKRFWHIRSFIHHVLNWGLGFWANISKYNKFRRFFLNNMIKTKFTYDYDKMMSLSSIEGLDIDTFVCESDVIWKLYAEDDFDDVFFLNIPAAKGRIKVAYAPSLGSRLLNEKETFHLKSLTKDFKAISTREQQGADYLSSILQKKIQWVLDPTLLLDAIDYQRITVKPEESNYILVYNCMVNDKEMVREAEELATRENKILIEISNWYENKFLFNHMVKNDVGIEEFLGYFQYSDFIICNAFHGFCFSVIFKKQIFLFQRDESDFRMKNITDALGLSGRFIPWNNKHIPSHFCPIDYEEVYVRLSEHRERAAQYIKENIIN